MYKSQEEMNKIIEEYRRKPYDQLEILAEQNYVDTIHPDGDNGPVQIGIAVFYDDKSEKTIRCIFSLYDDGVRKPKWWKIWQIVAVPVTNDGFIMNKDGKFIDE